MLSQAELETEGSGLATIFGLPPTPRVYLEQVRLHNRREQSWCLY